MGCGKSTVLNAIYNPNLYEDAYRASASMDSETIEFNWKWCKESLGCILVDTPGQGDANIHVGKWEEQYKKFKQARQSVNLIVYVFNATTRGGDKSNVESLAYLNQMLEKFTDKSVVFIANRAPPGWTTAHAQKFYQTALGKMGKAGDGINKLPANI